MKEELKRFPISEAIFLMLVLFLLPLNVEAQQYTALTKQRMRMHMKFLASDAMEGRETGTAGQKKVAEYLADQMVYSGLQPVSENGDYYQKFVLSTVQWDTLSLEIGGERLKENVDFFAPRHPNSSADINVDELVYLGYGIDSEIYSDYRKNKVENKLLLIREGEPMKNSKEYLLSGTELPSDMMEANLEKLKLAKRMGASAVILVTDNMNEAAQRLRNQGMYRRLIIDSVSQVLDEYPPFVIIPEKRAEQLLGKQLKKAERRQARAVKTGNFKAITIKKTNLSLTAHKNIDYIYTENVAGMLPGVDSPENGYLIVTAHYDHLGKRGNSIYNGADDNGSGTTALLVMMEEFLIQSRLGRAPMKPILFIFMTGEEMGLLGSSYYVNNPLLPLEDAYANVNIDMIGRMDEHHKNPDYIYVIGADKISTELDRLVKEVAENVKDSINLLLDYRYNSESDPNRFYYRSDHYNFARNGIPAVFFFTGVHEDYHMPTDTEDKIMYTPMLNRTRFIYELIKAAANRTDPFPKDVK